MRASLTGLSVAARESPLALRAGTKACHSELCTSVIRAASKQLTPVSTPSVSTVEVSGPCLRRLAHLAAAARISGGYDFAGSTRDSREMGHLQAGALSQPCKVSPRGLLG